MSNFDPNQTCKEVFKEETMEFKTFSPFVCFISAIKSSEGLKSYENYQDLEVGRKLGQVLSKYFLELGHWKYRHGKDFIQKYLLGLIFLGNIMIWRFGS